MGNKHNNKKRDIKNINSKEKEIINEIIQFKKTQKNKNKIIYKYNILFVGEAGIGTKTSLIKRIKEGKFIDNIEDKKLFSEQIIYEEGNKEIILYLIDTNAEIEEKREKTRPDEKIERREYIINKYYKNADCIIMGYNVTNKQSFEEIKSFWFNNIKEKTKTNLIYLLGNKIDLIDNVEVIENEVIEFAEMNKIKYFPLSVKNDINIQNIFDDIKNNLKNIKNKNNNGINEIIYGNPSKEKYKIILLGDSGVGNKTSFQKVIFGEEFNPDEMSTCSQTYSRKEINLKNGNKIIIDIWDTVGQKNFRSLTSLFIKDSDCVVLGYDITVKESFDSIDDYWYPTSKEISGTDLIYLIANKIDLYDNEKIPMHEAMKYAANNKMKFFGISCKKYIGIKEFLDDLIDELIKK